MPKSCVLNLFWNILCINRLSSTNMHNGTLIIGFFWSSQCGWALLMNPDAFISTHTGKGCDEAELLYFNFVTLTSLGYGDIVPTTYLARITAVFNCLSGVLYLAVFISALVGGLAKQKGETAS